MYAGVDVGKTGAMAILNPDGSLHFTTKFTSMKEWREILSSYTFTLAGIEERNFFFELND